MNEEDAERLLDDLRLLEPLLDGNPRSLCDGRKALAASLLRAMGGLRVAEPRLVQSIEGLCFAVRGCYEDSRQMELLCQMLDTCGILDAREVAMRTLWSRAREAVGELRDEMDLYRRRSS